MGVLQDVIMKTVKSLSKEQLFGVTKFRSKVLFECKTLQRLEIPNSVEFIGGSAFYNCTSLTEIDSSDMNPYCKIDCDSEGGTSPPFEGTGWLNNQPQNSMVLMANGKILVHSKTSTPSQYLIIPDTVVNIASMACQGSDSNFTSFVIPDSVEIVMNNILSSSTLTKITVGRSVRYIEKGLVPSTNVTTLIFRQPAGMYVELPEAGNGKGLAYDKSSRSVAIYTDNEYIKNYPWSTDNVTATFYPLSSAPA